MNTSACQRLNVLLSVFAAIAAICMASPSAQAATKTWNNAGTVWTTAGDWTGGAPVNDLTTDIALFNSTLFSNQPNYGNTSVSGIQVGDGTTVTGPITLTGTTLTLGSGGITIAANAGTVSLANSVLIGSNQSWTNNSSSLFTVGATITNLGNVTPFTLTLKGSGSGGMALTGIISDGGATGTTALTVNTTGSGVTTLSGANTYTGATTLTSGILRATTSASALGTGAATLSLGGGELQLANASGTNLSFSRNTTVTGNTQITSDLTASGAANTYTLGTLAIGVQQLNIRAGSNVTSGTAGVTFGTTTLSASGTVFDVGSNANLTLNTLTGAFNFWKQNSGTLTLASTSGTRATGATFLTGGTLVMGGTGNGTATDSLGTAAAPTINLFNGTTLDLATGIAAGSSVAAHPTNIYGSATILADANTASTAGFTQTLGALTVLGPNTLTIGKGGNVTGGTPVVAFGAATINAATTFSVNTGSALTLNSTLGETGNGTITFTGAGNSTVTGIISGGGGLAMSGTGLLTLTAANTYTGPTNLSGGTVTIGNATSLGAAATAVLNMSGTSTLNTNNLSASLLALNDSSTTAVIQNGGSTTASTLTVTPVANTTSTFAGTIQDGGGTKTQAVTVNGVGALSLSGANTYTGATTLTAGQLNINSATALGTSTLTLTKGIIDNTSGSDVTLTNNNAVTLPGGAGNYLTFGGSGNLSFGSGTATLTTSYSVYLMGTGGKALSFGTWNDNMAISTTTIYAMPGSNSTVNFGKYISTSTATAGTIAGNANITITGGIQPTVPTASSIVYSSAGTLTLSGASTYTGATTFNGGTFILDNTGGATTFSSSSAPTFAGGTFIYKGASAGSNQTLGNVTLTVGAAATAVGMSSIQVVGGTSGTTTLALGTMLDANNNSLLNINLSGTGAAVTTSTGNTANIFGTRGAVTVTTGGTTEFATVSGTSLVQYTGQTAFTGTTTGTTTNYSVADSQTLTTAASTPNSIKITTTANNGSLDLGANTMKITSGGILFTGANTGYQIKGTNAAALSSGTATASDLIIHNFGTGGLTISAVIANGTGTSVVSLDGTGVTTLSGVNTYTGITSAGGGAVLNISADSGLGAVATGAALTLNNATLQAGATFALDNSSGTGTAARAIALGVSGGTFDTQANTLTVSGVISGAGSLTKIGSGTLILSGINTFTGGFTNIQNGTAVIGTKIGSTVGLLTASTMVTLGSGANSGVLQLGDSGNAAPQTIAGLFTLGSGSTNAIVGGNAGNSTLTFTGSLLTPSTFNGSLGGAGTNNNNLALAVTTGQLTLGGASTYTGPTTVTGGVLNINNNAALGASTLAVNLATAVIDNTSGGAKTMTNNNAVTTTTGFVFGGSNNLSFGSGTLSTTLAATPISVWGNSTLTFGSLINNIAAGTGLTLTVNGSTGTLSLGGFNMQANTAAALTDTINGSGNVNITGAITPGSFNAGNALTYSGTGVLTLSGANTYTGLTTMNNAGGTLKFGSGGSLNGGAGALTLTAGTVDVGGQAITVGNFTASAGLVTSSSAGGSFTATIPSAATLGNNFSGALSVNLSTASSGNTATNGNFYNTGNLTFTNVSTNTNTLTVGGTSAAPVGNITLNQNGATGGLIISTSSVNNTGTITSSGSGSGTTTISGNIGPNVTGIYQTGASPFTISSGLLLNSNVNTFTSTGSGLWTFSGGITGQQNLTLNANSTGGITLSTGAVNSTGTITNSGTSSGTTTISSNIGSSVTNITQSSATSTLTLSGTNTFTGGIALNAGTLIGSAAGALGTASNTTTFGGAGTATLNLQAAATTFTGLLNVAGADGTVLVNPASSGAGVTHTIGAVTLGNGHQLTVQGGGNVASGTAQLTTGAVNLIGGNETFNVINPVAGGTSTILQLGALSDDGTLRTITKTGTGTLTLGAAAGSLQANTTFVISAGTLQSSNATALGTTPIIWDGGTFAANATFTLSQLLSGSGAAGANNVSLVSGTLTLGDSNNLSTTISGVVSGTGALAAAGTGTLTLGGGTANTYGGNTTLGAGTLLLAKTGSANAIAGGGLTVGVTTANTAATVQYTGASSDMMGAGTVTLNGRGILDFNGKTDTIGPVTIVSTGATTSNPTPIINTAGGGALTIGALGITPVAGFTSVVNAGTGTLTLGGDVTFTAATTGQAQITGTALTWGALRTFTVGHSSATPYDLLVDSAITDGGFGLVKAGTGTLALTGANGSSYTGPTSINAGTLNFGSGSLGNGSGTITLGGGTLQYAAAANTQDVSSRLITTGANTLNIDVNNNAVSFGTALAAANIAGSGGLTLTSTTAGGSLTLTGTNSYTGPTTVTSGTLNLTGSLSGATGNITINGATAAFNESGAGSIAGSGKTFTVTAGSATLAGSNTYAGATTLTAGTLQLANTAAITSSALTLNGGTLQLRNDSAGTFATSGSTTVGAAVTVDVNQVTGAGSNNQLSLGAVSIGAFALTSTGGNGYSLGLGAVTLTGAATLAPTTANMTVASATLAANALMLGGTGAGTIGAITSTTGGVTKNTGATWTLTGTNTYAGATALSNGTMNVSGALSSVGLVTVSANGVLTESATNALTGSTALTLSGGSVVLNQANNFSGATTLGSTGYLVLSNTNAVASSALTFNSTNGAILALRNDSNATFNTASLTVGGLATIDVNRATSGGVSNGVLTLGPVSIGAFTLNVTGGNGYSLSTGALTLTGAATLNPTTANMTVASVNLGTNTLTLGGGTTSSSTIGAIGATAGLVTTKIGGGTWTLNGANLYTGATTVVGGVLNITGSLGNTAVTINSVTGGTLSLQAASAISQNTVALTGTSGVGVGILSETVDNALSGTAALTVSGVGGLAILDHANNNSGATTLSAGILRLSHTGAIASSALTLSGSGTLQLRSDTSVTFNKGSATLSGGTIDVGPVSTGSGQTLNLGAVTLGAATTSFTGSNGYTLELGASTLSGNAGLSPTSGVLLVDSVALGTNTLTLNGTATGTIGAITGTTGGVTVNNTVNTWVLTGTNTYTGNTSISTGTMNITGAMGNTAVSISSGGLVLGGSGALNQKTLAVSGSGLVTETVDNGLGGTVATTINAGSVILDHANNTTGATVLNAGTLQLSNAGALATSALTLAGGTLQLRNDSATTFTTASTTVGAPTTIDVNQATGAGSNNQLSLGPVSIAAQTLTATGANGYSLGLGAVTQTGAATFNATSANINIASVGGAYNLTLDGATTGNTVGAITTAAGTLTKNGSGTWTLTGTNTETGAITVNAGTLQRSGASGTNASTAYTLAGGSFVVDNTTAAGGNNNTRIADAATLALNGGSFTYKGADAASTNSTETIGAITGTGNSTLSLVAGGSNTAQLTAASFGHSAGNGSILVNGASLGANATAANILILTAAPALTGTTAALATGINSVQNTKIVPFLVGEATSTTGGLGTATGTANTFVTYVAGSGLRPLNLADEFTGNAITTGTNTYVTSATSAGSTDAINSLIVNGGDLAIGNGVTLTDTSGALLFSGSNGITGTTGILAIGAEGMVTVNSGVTGTITAIVSGTALTKGGAGTLVLGGANTYTGTTTVTAGTLKLGTGGSLVSTNALTTATNGTFDLGGNSQTLGVVTNAGTITNSGTVATLTVGNGSGATGGFSGNLGLVVNAGATASTFSGNETNTGNITLNANGAGAITVSTGTLNNTGTITNSGSGAGVVTLNNIGANVTGIVQNSGTSVLTLSGTNASTGGVTITTGTVKAGSATGLGTGTVTIGATGTLDINNIASTTGLLSSTSGSATVTNSGATLKSLTLSGTGTSTFAGVIGGGSKLGLTLTGGTQILSGTNTYTGTTTVAGGTLQINGAAAMASSTALTLSGGTLALRGDTDATFIGGSTAISAATTIDVNQLTGAGSNHTLSLGAFTQSTTGYILTVTGGNGYTLGLGAVTASSATNFNPTTANLSIASLTAANWGLTLGGTSGNNTIGAIANGTGVLTKNTSATWTLSGTNTYTGNTNLSAGTTNISGAMGNTAIALSGGALNLQGAGAVSQNTVTVSNAAVLTESGSGSMTGTAALTLNGYGASAFLNNANTYSGATTLSAASGVLQLGNVNSIQNSALALNGGTLRLRNDAATTFADASTTVGGNVFIDVNQTTGSGSNNQLSLGAVSIGAFTVNALGGNGYSLGLGAVTQTGAATFNANGASLNLASVTGTFNLTVGGGANTTIGNITTTTGTLTKNGGGTLTLNGAASTITGAITLNSGTLNATTASLNGGSATNGITLNTESVLQAGSGGITTSKAFTIIGPAVSSSASNGTGNGTGIFDTNGYSSTLTGVIPAGTFVVTGSGTLVLTGATTNAFTNLVLLGGTTNASNTSANAANSTITFNGGTLQASAAITAAKAITLGGAGGVFDTNGFNSGITGVVSGVGALTKAGAGTLTLSGANVAFNGGLTISNGTVTAGVATSAIGVGNVTFGTSNTPTLDINSLAETTGFLSGAGTNGVVANTGGTAAILTIAGGGTATFGGVINGTALSLTKSGPGTQILNGSAASAYTGTTTLTGGTLKLDFTNLAAATNLISATSPLVMSGGTLSILGNGTTATNQTVASLNASAGAVNFVIAPVNGVATTLTITSTAVTGTSTVNFNTSAGTPATAMIAWNPTLTSGIIGGAYTITDNTGTNFATVSAGKVVALTGATALTSAASASTTNFSTTPTDPAYASGTLTMTNAAHTLNSLTIASGSGGTLDLGGNSLALTSAGLLMTGAGNYSIIDGTLAPAGGQIHQFGTGTLTIGANFGSGAVALAKDGPGTLVLTAANTFTSGVFINGGVVQISSLGNIGPSGSDTLNGGTLQVTSAGFDLARNLYSKGAGGTLQVDAGTLTESTAITLYDKSNLTISGAGNLAITGAIQDSGAGGGVIIAPTYSGTATLSGNSNFTGGLTINGGTVVATSITTALGGGSAANALQLNGGQLTLTNPSGTNLAFNRNTAIGGNTQITSDVTATGAGNTYTLGTLAIGNNTLTVAGGPNVASGTAGLTFGATTLTGNATFSIVNPTSGATTLLTVGAIVNGTNNLTLTGNGNFAQAGVWGPGSGGLILDSAYTGTAALNQNNTFSGGVTIKSGVLTITNNVNNITALVATGLGTGTVLLGDTTGGSAHNASLLLPNAATMTVANNIVVQAGNAGQAILGSVIPNPLPLSGITPSTITFSGLVTLNKDLVISPGNTLITNGATGMVFNALTGTGGIIVSATGMGVSSSGQSYGIGAGTVTLTGPNNYQGDTKIYAGVLNLVNVGSGDLTSWVGTSTNAIVLGDTGGNQSARLHLTMPVISNTFTRAITTQAGSGGIAAISTSFINGGNSPFLTGNITLNKPIYLNAASSSFFSGVISDAPGAIGGMSVALSSVGPFGASTGNATLSGANTYDGGTIVGAGILTGNSTGAFGLGNAVVDMGTLVLNSMTHLASNKTVLVGASGGIGINSTTITQSYLQSVIDPNSSGTVGLGVSYAGNLNLATLGNGLMFLGTVSNGGTMVYSGTTLGANSDGNYRIGNVVTYGTGNLTIANSVLVDGTGPAQLIVGGLDASYNRVGGYGVGTVLLTGSNTYSGGTVVNSNSTLTGTQTTVAGTSPFGSSTGALTLHNGNLKLVANGTSTVGTAVGALSFDGSSSISVTGGLGGVNTLTVGEITRVGNSGLIVGSFNTAPTGTFGVNTILKTSGTAPATVATVDTNGAGTANAAMIAPYFVDNNGNYLSYNGTTGFTPITTSIVTTDGAPTNAFVKTIATGGPTVISTSATIAALSLGGNLLSSSAGDITLTITTGGLNNLYYTNNVSSNSGLQIGNNGTTNRINLNFNGQEAVIFNTSNQNGGMAIWNNITNTGGNGLTKAGYGILSLNSTTSDFTGTVTINGNGDNANGSMLSINSDLQLGGVGAALNNGLTLNGGGLYMNIANSSLTLNANRLVTIGEAGAYFYMPGSSTNTTVYNNLTIQGKMTGTGSQLMFASGSGLNTQVSSTISFTNTANDFVAPIYLGGLLQGRMTLAFSDDRQLGNSANTVTLLGGNSILQYTGATGASTVRGIVFGDEGGGIDVVNAVTLTASGPISGDGVFNKNGNGTLALTGSGSYAGSVIVNAGVLVAGNNFALGVSDAVVSGNSGVSGGAVFVESAGELDLQGNIALGGTGGKTLYLNGSGTGGNGALRNVSGANSDTGAVVLQSNTTIGVDADSLTLSGALSGTGYSLTKVGAGNLTLAGANTYTGATTVNGGILTFLNTGAKSSGSAVTAGASGTIGLGVGAVSGGYSSANVDSLFGNTLTGFTLNAASGIALDTTAGNFTYATSQTNLHALTKLGINTLTLTGANTYGATTISAGALQLGSGSTTGSLSTTGAIVDNGSLIINRSNAVVQGTDFSSSAITGAGTFTQAGSGTTTLNAANAYNGVTAVNAGTLAFNSVAAGAGAQALGTNSSVTLGVAGTSSGILQYTGGTGTLDKNVTALGNGLNTIQNSGAGLLTLSGSLVKNGTILALNGSLNVTGVISGGAANSDLDITGGTTTLSTLATYNGPTAVYGGGTLVNNVSGGALPTGTTLTLGEAATNTAGTFDLNGNAQTVSGLNTAGTAGASNIVTNSGGGSATLTVNNGGAFAGTIQNGTGGTALALGGGTLILSGANTYTGGTTVSGGTLLVNNTSGSGTGTGTLAIASGGTLGGTGTIGSVTTIAGALNPGASPGILTFSSAVTLQTGSTTTIVINGSTTRGTDYTGINFNGGLTVTGGTLTFNIGVPIATGSVLNVFTVASISPTFTSVAATGVGGYSGGFTLDTGSDAYVYYFGGQVVTFDLTSGNLIFAIPEPSTYAAIFGVLALVGTALYRRRKVQPKV